MQLDIYDLVSQADDGDPLVGDQSCFLVDGAC